MKTVSFLFAAMFLLPRFAYSSEARIVQVSGTAEVKYANQDLWYAAKSGERVIAGQHIKTKPRSRVKVTLGDGSRLEILPNSVIDLKELTPRSSSIHMGLGRLKAWVTKRMNRKKFEVRTPVAVCSVRGTEFGVSVDEKGATDIEVYEGVVGVRKIDGIGEEIPVGAGERLDVSPEQALRSEQKTEFASEESEVRREVGLEMSKEAVQAAAAEELRLAEYQEGKALIDAFGQRVRLEEYIVRPAKDTFKLVVLNERENRFDYFYYRGKFNKELPADLSVALKDMGGKTGDTAPEYYLTEYEKAFSNTQDYAKDTASGGHLIKIVYNADGTFTLADADDAANTRTVNAADSTYGAYDPLADTFDPSKTSALEIALYNPDRDGFETFTAGQTLWKTRFNSYEHVLNGVRKQWYLPSNAQKNILVADLDGHWIYPARDSQGNTVYGEWGTLSTETTQDGAALHDRMKITYRDNTFEQYDTYIISDDGAIAARDRFSGITSGSAYKEELLKWNYEQVLTASEFNGRKIDLVIEPKILIKSGILR